ncbi:DUF1593-domain-containing protein [Amniculicola lignicola CBS 123094]|uniref:DUF1593-domain-containing protein n=1 Tax=Amniculicola lignicola CBS 123094 TaxID=1392246 RepID=A0A6A5WWT0_9PLEO|nr:DUF1593-domain-containing protein [Amniculicola lignicola CBS 123094]
MATPTRLPFNPQPVHHLPPPSKPKPRVFILTDISPEASAGDSLARYLLYANQFETEGLVACTSARNPEGVFVGEIEKVLEGYGRLVGRLNRHAGEEVGGVGSGGFWPRVEELRGVVRGGSEIYGLAALSDAEPLSPGAQLLFERIVKPSQRPLWVLAWGGTNTLASVLYKIDNDYTPEDAARLLSRIRVYAISDQDDTGAWIRSNFPSVCWIGSVHGFGQYSMAAWSGISGEDHYGFDQGGPDRTKITPEWIEDNIQLGPFANIYNGNSDPILSSNSTGILEEATPSFLYLIQNGLSYPEAPDFGSWGGRYISTNPPSLTPGPPHPLSLGAIHYSDAVDTVFGRDGRSYTSNHATIWRWRSAIQNDFAARVQWSLTPFAGANHHPIIVINGAGGIAPVKIEAEAGSEVVLDASKTHDPDGDGLMFKWWQYREPSCTSMSTPLSPSAPLSSNSKPAQSSQSLPPSLPGFIPLASVGTLSLAQVDGHATKVKVRVPPPEVCAVDVRTKRPVARGQVLHLILEVMDDGVPALTSYRRVMIQVTNRDLRGGVEVKAPEVEGGVVMKEVEVEAKKEVEKEVKTEVAVIEVENENEKKEEVEVEITTQADEERKQVGIPQLVGNEIPAGVVPEESQTKDVVEAKVEEISKSKEGDEGDVDVEPMQGVEQAWCHEKN